MHRFFVPPDRLRTDAPSLNADEAHHCVNVLRHRIGDRVAVFDGNGREATAEIIRAAKREVALRIIERRESAPLAARVTLAQAIPKGKNMDLIVEKAVELGAATIAPLLTERTVVHLDARDAAAKREKWRTVALEACKQCGQNRLPDVATPVALEVFLEARPPSGLLLIGSLQPDARSIKSALANYAGERGAPPDDVTILIGPEGDFTPAEIDLAKARGARPITLGPIILRTETAAIYCLSVLGHELFSRAPDAGDL